MMRWHWKRWLWAGMFSTTAVVGLTWAQTGSNAPPPPVKVGDTITLKFKDGPDRQVKVLKTEKQADGSIMSEVKDMKSGETFALMDRPAEPVTSTATSKAAYLPKARERVADPLMPFVKETPADKRPLLPVKSDATPALGSSAPVAGVTPMPTSPVMNDTSKRPTLLGRLFGKKPTTGVTVPTVPTNASITSPITPSVPAPIKTTPTLRLTPTATVSNPTAPVVTAPAIRTPPLLPKSSEPMPTPPPALLPIPIPPAATSSPVVLPMPSGTTEPPRVLPMRPVAPPSPVIPTPVTPPVASPMPTPAPLPMPTAPGGTSLPPIALPPIPLPPIPMAPNGMSRVGSPVVTPASFTTPEFALVKEIQPYAAALQSADTVSERVMGARALAGCRHASTDVVKALLCRAAMTDPHPSVRACCIEKLCKLGCYHPSFMSLLESACDDPSDEVKSAANVALSKMTARK